MIYRDMKFSLSPNPTTHTHKYASGQCVHVILHHLVNRADPYYSKMTVNKQWPLYNNT